MKPMWQTCAAESASACDRYNFRDEDAAQEWIAALR